MEFQYHNILKPGFYEGANLNCEDNANILPVIIIAVTIITVGYYFYYRHTIKKREQTN